MVSTRSEETVLPPSDTVSVAKFEKIFHHRATSYKFLFLLSLLELLKHRGFGGWENIGYRRIAVEMLTLLYKPFSHGLILADRTKERFGPAFAAMKMEASPNSERSEVHEKILLHYNAEEHGDILALVPYRLIRPFCEDLELTEDYRSDDELINKKIIAKADEYFDQLKPLYRLHIETESLDVHPDWGHYISAHYDVLHDWVCEQWLTYLQNLNPAIESLRELIFWPPQHRNESRQLSRLHDAESFSFQAPPDAVPVSREQVQASLPLPDLPPVLFNGIPHNEGVHTITRASQRLCEELEKLPIPRSLCELKCSRGDVDWLKKWLRNLNYGHALNWLVYERYDSAPGIGASKRQALGLLLFLFLAESVRHELREGSVWNTFRSFASEKLYDVLFVQHHPNGHLLSALVDAASRFALRNVFGRPGVQQYYISIYLQFGITARGFAQIGHWLYSPPETVLHLTSETCASTYSAEFTTCWNRLRDYRAGDCTRSAAQTMLEHSPWFVIDRFESAFDSIAARSQSANTSVQPQPIATLKWKPNEQPKFEYRITGLNTLHLSDDIYMMKLGDVTLSRVVRGQDDCFSDVTVTLPADHAIVIVELKSMDDELITTWEVELWSDDEDIECFELPRGERYHWASALNRNSTYAILASDLLEPTDKDVQWTTIAPASKKLWLIPVEKLAQWQLNYEGEVFWQPVLSGERAPCLESLSVRTLDTSNLTDNDEIHLSVTGVPADVSVRKGKIGTLALNFERYSKYWFSRPEFFLPQALGLNGLQVSLLLQRADERFRLVRPVKLNMNAVLKWSNKKWTYLSRGDSITARSAKLDSFKIFLPEILSDNAEDVALFEGETYCRPFTERRQPIGALGGYGASLCAAPAFIGTKSKNVCTLISEVIDTGVISSWVYTNGKLRILLNRCIEPTDLHEVFLWSYQSEPFVIGRASVTCSSTTWELQVPNREAAKPLAVAIAYDGHLLGSLFTDTHRYARLANDTLTPETAAALLKWWHAPILSKSMFPQISKSAHAYPAEYLGAWLDQDGLPGNLSFSEDEEFWLSAAREVFAGYKPNPAQAQAILATLKGNSTFDQALLKLFRLSPELATKIIKKTKNTPDFQVIGHSLKSVLPTLVRFPPAPTYKLLQLNQGAVLLLEESSSALNIDSTCLKEHTKEFVHRVIEGIDVPDYLRHNISSCLRSPTYRNYLSALFLLELAT